MPSALRDVSWQEQAACRAPKASEAFYPPEEGERRNERRKREARAISICNTCPVVEHCLAYALAIRERHGVWGATGEIERRVLIKSRSQN